jgi:hypothetical protein
MRTIPLNTQTSTDLGGCSNKYDVSLNFKGHSDVHIEAKGKNAPDWMQICIVPKKEGNNIWLAKKETCASPLFNSVLRDEIIFNERIPPFLQKKEMTYDEWTSVAHCFRDQYIPCDPLNISKAYKSKGVDYIQVKGFGLYHTGTDTCSFNVPLFQCQQNVRIRCKRHGKRCRITGKNLPTTVMAAFRPVLSTLVKSPFSLDSVASAPTSLERFDGVWIGSQ